MVSKHRLGRLKVDVHSLPVLEAGEPGIKVWAGPRLSGGCEGQSAPSLSPGGLSSLGLGQCPSCLHITFSLRNLNSARTLSYWFRAHPKDPILTQLPAKTFPSKVTLTATGDRAPTSSGGTATCKRGRGRLSALGWVAWPQVPPGLPCDGRSAGCCPHPGAVLVLPLTPLEMQVS